MGAAPARPTDHAGGSDAQGDQAHASFQNSHLTVRSLIRSPLGSQTGSGRHIRLCVSGTYVWTLKAPGRHPGTFGWRAPLPTRMVSEPHGFGIPGKASDSFRIAQANTRAAAIPLNELDASGLQGKPNGSVVGRRQRCWSMSKFGPSDSRNAYGGRPSKILGTPPYQRACGPNLVATQG